MKKINRKLIKGTNWALSGLISLLGFSSCGKIIDDGGLVAEYGTPYAKFIVSGKVTDAQNQGLEGICVTVPKVDHYQRATAGFIPDQNLITEEVRDTLYTREGGNFSYLYSGFPTNDSINIHMKFEDVSEEGRFEADSKKVTFFSSELIGGEGWFNGQAEKTLNVALKNKESE
jgi:putative lipoprotein (rSAM/lipoprotein system)